MAGGPVPLNPGPAGTGRRRLSRFGSRLDPLAAGAVVVPVVAMLVTAGLVRTGPWGDQAAIQLATDRAARFTQLLGPYSRFGWSHPGPLYFYLLAGPYRALGGGGRGLVVASVLLTGLAAVALVLVVGRLGSRPAGRWAAALVAVELAALGPTTVAEVWNPVAIIVPTGLFLVLCAGLAVGRWWMLVGAVAVGSFLVQTDVSTGLVVAVVGVAAVGAAAVRTAAVGTGAPGRADAERAPVPVVAVPVAVALVVAGLLWAAPVVQQLTGSPGNLARVISFFRSGPPGHSWEAATRSVAGALWPPLEGRFGSPPSLAASVALLVAAVAVAGVVLGAGLRRFDRGGPVDLDQDVSHAGRLPPARLGAALAAAAGLTAVVGVVSATRATGTLYGYLTEWLSAVPVVLGLGLALVLPGRARPGRWAGAAAVLAAGALVALAAVDRPGPLPGGTEVDALWASVRPALPAPGPERGRVPVEVAVATSDRWPWAGGLLVDLDHAGYRPVAPPAWRFLFGTQLAYSGRPAATVSVWRSGSGPQPAGRLLARAGDTEVFLRPSSGGTSR